MVIWRIRPRIVCSSTLLGFVLLKNMQTNGQAHLIDIHHVPVTPTDVKGIRDSSRSESENLL